MPIDNRIFELLVETVRDYAVFVLDPAGNVATWNLGAAQLKGYTAREIIGQHFSVFYPEEARLRGWPAHELRMAMRDGRFEDEGWRVRQDGSRFWANVVISALRDEQGELLGFSKITRDLSARRESEELLRQSEERLRLLIEGVVDYALVMLDSEGVLSSWNSGAQRITGYTREEVLGKHLAHLYLPEDVESGLPWKEVALARASGRHESEGLRLRKSGSKFMARTILTSLHNTEGQLRGFAVLTQDLTTRQHAQELERTTRHVTEFIAILAHELRNPLTPIQNALHVMEQAPDNPGVQRAMRGAIGRQSVQLTRIVNDMLDVARVTSGSFSITNRTVNLRTVASRAVENLASEIARVRHTLSVNLPPEDVLVSGDVDRLVQVISNLLSNAVRFTPAGGAIALTVSCESGHALMSVRDNGRGIIGEDLSGIFAMFVQGKDPIHRVGGGLGIGLALSRQIAELHGGSIEARSAGTEQGSEFILRLPLLEAPVFSGAQPEAPTTVPGIAAKRVLVVDDNRDAADTLNMLLQSLGHSTRVAYDGPGALSMAEQFLPEVVFLDLGMPGMNGLEVARQLRARAEHPTKIVALSGWGSEVDRLRTSEAGFDVHLVKPVDHAELLSVLQENGTATAHLH